MLKLIFSFFFLMILCFFKKNYLMIQNFLFFIFFFILMLNFKLSSFNQSMNLKMDFLSFSLVNLSIWICSLMILASFLIYFKNLNFSKFILTILLLLLFLLLTFLSDSMFMFYFFFESSLIPTFFLILGWGYQPERLQAGLYLLFYTLFASLPLLMILFFINNFFFTMMFCFVSMNLEKIFFFFFLMFAFLVKMPMFMVHLWLPKAHVEAPVSGSMILAAILLKLGGYGIMRLFFTVQSLYNSMKIFFIVFSLMGGLIVSVICIRQVDLKSLVAYSSVAHMSLVIGGLFTFSIWGWGFSYLLMIAHGLCSSGLFFLVNVCYERLSSRSLMINKGMILFMPSLTFWWFLLCSSNMAAPPSLNLVGEIGLINSIMFWSNILILILMLISFFSAVYSLYLFSFSQHGKNSFKFFSFSMGNNREYLVLMLHWLPLNLLFLFLDLFILF